MECYVNGNEYTELERQQNEKDVLSSFITGHPAAVYQRLSPYLHMKDVRVITPAQVNKDECKIG